MNEIQNKKGKSNIITIYVSEYFTNELSENITAIWLRGTRQETVNTIRRAIYEGKYDSDCFNVVALNSDDYIIGRLFCLKNQVNPKLWYAVTRRDE